MTEDNLVQQEKFKRKGEEPTANIISMKLNEDDDQMIAIGRYMFCMESKSGVLKFLAHTGLKVLLAQLGADKMRYLTTERRKRYEQEKPDISKYLAKGNMNYD